MSRVEVAIVLSFGVYIKAAFDTASANTDRVALKSLTALQYDRSLCPAHPLQLS